MTKIILYKCDHCGVQFSEEVKQGILANEAARKVHPEYYLKPEIDLCGICLATFMKWIESK